MNTCEVKGRRTSCERIKHGGRSNMRRGGRPRGSLPHQFSARTASAIEVADWAAGTSSIFNLSHLSAEGVHTRCKVFMILAHILYRPWPQCLQMWMAVDIAGVQASIYNKQSAETAMVIQPERIAKLVHAISQQPNRCKCMAASQVLYKILR